MYKVRKIVFFFFLVRKIVIISINHTASTRIKFYNGCHDLWMVTKTIPATHEILLFQRLIFTLVMQKSHTVTIPCLKLHMTQNLSQPLLILLQKLQPWLFLTLFFDQRSQSSPHLKAIICHHKFINWDYDIIVRHLALNTNNIAFSLLVSNKGFVCFSILYRFFLYFPPLRNRGPKASIDNQSKSLSHCSTPIGYRTKYNPLVCHKEDNKRWERLNSNWSGYLSALDKLEARMVI